MVFPALFHESCSGSVATSASMDSTNSVRRCTAPARSSVRFASSARIFSLAFFPKT